MEEDKNPEPGNRLKTAGLVVACGLIGFVAVALGLMLADAAILYAMESSGGQPMLYVMERAEVQPEWGVIVPLTERDFADHPALDAVIRGEEKNPSAWEWGMSDQRFIGGTNVSYAESRALQDAYGPDRETGLYPHLEYEGAYYVVVTTWP